MSKKKGLSASDKQEVILGIYQELKLPMNLKEIENLASKRGVVQQTVKEMNQILVDDFVIYRLRLRSLNNNIDNNNNDNNNNNKNIDIDNN